MIFVFVRAVATIEILRVAQNDRSENHCAEFAAKNLSQRCRARKVRKQGRAAFFAVATAKANRFTRAERNFRLVDFGSADGAFASEISRTIGAD